MLKNFSTVILLLFCVSTSVRAQETSKSIYTPQVFGAVKAKFELSTVNGMNRFNVRNSRIGVKGLVSPQMDYSVQIDFNNEGKISILDTYAAYSIKNFKISLGQQQYGFSSDLDRGPSSNMFSNRSFIARYITTYYSSEIVDGKPIYKVSSIGSRDIGARLTYKFPETIPILLSFGIFNGSGVNNPEWANRDNIVTKIEIGRDKGFGGAVSYYGGSTPTTTEIVAVGTEYKNKKVNQKINMWGGELHYIGEKFLIEAEYAQRRLQIDGLQQLHAAHVHGFYKFLLPKNIFAHHIAPHLRWDIGRGVEYYNTVSNSVERFNANRVTAALNVGLTEKMIRSEIRIGYEKFFVDDHGSDFHTNPMLHDKFTIEFIAAF